MNKIFVLLVFYMDLMDRSSYFETSTHKHTQRKREREREEEKKEGKSGVQLRWHRVKRTA